MKLTIKKDRYRGTKDSSENFELGKTTIEFILKLLEGKSSIDDETKFFKIIENGVQEYLETFHLNKSYSHEIHAKELYDLNKTVTELHEQLLNCHILAYRDIAMIQALGALKNPTKKAGGFKRNGKHQIVKLASAELEKTLEDFKIGYEKYAQPKKKTNRGDSHTDIHIITKSIINALKKHNSKPTTINSNSNGMVVKIFSVLLDNEIEYKGNVRSIVSNYLKTDKT